MDPQGWSSFPHLCLFLTTSAYIFIQHSECIQRPDTIPCPVVVRKRALAKHFLKLNNLHSSLSSTSTHNMPDLGKFM